MKLSTRGRYGLKAMYELAKNYGGGPLAVAELARRQGVSDAYLEHLISALKKAGLIHSVRGAAGGYVLTLPPGRVTVGDILRVLEGSTSLVECIDQPGCENESGCSTRPLYLRIQNAIDEVLNSTSLQDMLDANCDSTLEEHQ